MVDLIEKYISRNSETEKENSNMAFSLQGLNNEISSQVTKKFWLERLYTPDIRQAHESGDIHLHDLNLLAVYCVGWDLVDLLTRGFGGVVGKVETSPAKHFSSALGQICNFIYTLQGEASGAQAFSNVDTLLAPFIAHDKLSYEDVKQCMQEFIFNMNVSTRVGFQTPFSNFSLDWNVPENMREQPVIIGGKLQDSTYGEFQREVDMFNKAFLEVMCEGDAKGRVFTFPIPTYSITKEFDYEDPRNEPLWRATAKYGLPYFANFVNSDMSPEDVRSMCCRLRIDNAKLEKRGGGLFGANPLTGSVGVVTINLPRIGIETDTEYDFFCRLDELLELAKESLQIKRKILEKYTDAGLFPYSKVYLDCIKQRTGKYWTNHFSTIGIIGLNEASVFVLKEEITETEGELFAIRVMDHIRKRLEEFQVKTGEQFNLEATPAEGASHRLTKLDRKKHPDRIRTRLPYTNSSMPFVDSFDDPFELLEHQDKFQCKYTGGTVLHFFVGERIESTASVKQFVKAVCDNYRLPYFSITPTFSICKNHGYISGEKLLCPHCKEETEVYSRVVGYLRPISQWNESKQKEFFWRRTFSL